jgi:hypothetical protein
MSVKETVIPTLLFPYAAALPLQTRDTRDGRLRCPAADEAKEEMLIVRLVAFGKRSGSLPT